MRKSILIAICSLLCTSLAFSNAEKAPPIPSVKEAVFNLSSVDYGVVCDLPVVNERSVFVFVEKQTEISIVVSSFIPDFHPGYFYRNIVYENYLKENFISQNIQESCRGSNINNSYSYKYLYLIKIDPGLFNKKGFASVHKQT